MTAEPSSRAASGTRADAWHVAVVVLVLTAHAGLLAWGAWSHSPTWDEPGHLVAGIGLWQAGRLDLDRVNTPLVRAIAAIPVLYCNPGIDWLRYSETETQRQEWDIGRDFLKANGARAFWLFMMARWACIPLSLAGGMVCYAWARELYGRAAGLLALGLWCFSPNVIACGQLITADAGGTAFGAASCYAFWRWLDRPTWTRALAAGVAMGVASLSRTTWVLLFGLQPLLWAFYIVARHRRAIFAVAHGCHGQLAARVEKTPLSKPSVARVEETLAGKPPVAPRGAQLLLILSLGLYVLNLGYGFSGTFRKLSDYRFASRALSGKTDGTLGNRFAGTWLGSLPVPAPRDLVLGIDVQKAGFDEKSYSYLGGKWRLGGWWYYYLYALAIKVPLGTWGLAILALALRPFGGRFRADWRDELVLLAPCVLILALASSQTGFNRHFRYLLPMAPFAFIWTSRIAGTPWARNKLVAGLAGGLFAWSVASSLWIYPHSLSYFNELTGGPRNGHAYLGSSNVDWGQDLLYLKAWLEGHPEAHPLGLAFDGGYDPGSVGLDGTDPPETPLPGWYVLSVNRIHGIWYPWGYFLRFEPRARIGYSMFAYHVTVDDANRVRRELGLVELPTQEAKRP